MLEKLLADASSSVTSISGDTSSTGTDASLDKIKDLFKGPTAWIVLGVIVLAILIWCIVRRLTKAPKGSTLVILRGNKIFKLLNGDNPNDKPHYLLPFKDKVGASIPNNEIVYESDKLLVNDGPDKLYKITYTISYKVVDIPNFYNKCKGDANNVLDKIINDSMRLYAYKGNASILLNTYIDDEDKLIKVVNDATNDLFIEVLSFKVKSIQPLGNK